jgi:hypothetical protein
VAYKTRLQNARKKCKKIKKSLNVVYFSPFCQELKISYEKIQPESVAFCFDIGRHYTGHNRVQDLWHCLGISQ